jgi:diguanylate cyclase (GGDEF)-like protein
LRQGGKVAEPGNGSRRPVAGAAGGWWFWAWVAFCGLIAVLLLGLSVSRLTADEAVALGAPFALIAGLVLIAELRPVVTAGAYDPQGVTISTAFVFAILFYWGPWPALLVHGIGVVLGEIAKRKPVWKIVFNTGQYVGCLALSALILWLAGLRPTPTHPSGDIDAHTLLVMAVSWAAYFLLNLAMVATAISLRTGTRWWDDFVDDIDYYAVTTFAVLALSPVVVVVTKASWGLIPLLLLPLFLVYKTASISLEKEHAAMHDALTGLANRKRLIEQMAVAGEEAERTGNAVALCLLDLDRFKEINDTLGHHTGDRLLEIAANRLARAVRPEDTVARLGGDEFAVLLTDVSGPADALEAAERIRALLSEPFHLDGMALQVETSIGVALHPEHTDSVPRLLQLADVAMYQAKEERTGVELYRQERDMHTPDRLDLLGSVRRAIENDELEMHFQPAVSVPAGMLAGRPVSIEALVRWNHPERGLIFPDVFLDLVEQSGLMRQLTHLVLAKSLARAAQWWHAGIEVPVAVNVSVRDLSDAKFADVVAGLLREHDLPARALKLEITEHVLMADPGRMTHALESIGRLGVDLSLDDFGTGYSSLVHLKRLPVSELKVDRSFVQRMTSDPDDAAIVRSIVDLAHSLGLRVVAEGVETIESWHALEALGCDLAQGYLISRPVPGDEVIRWLAAHIAPGDAMQPLQPAPEAVAARP